MPDILPLLQCLQPVLSKTQCRQLARIVLAMLAMTGRITQRNIARWTQQGGSYRSVQRFFQTSLPWLEIKWRFFACFLYRVQDTYLLVGDETVCAKAGKKTFGLDRFFSSVIGKPIPGVAFFGFCLVSVQQRHAYPLCAEQVVRTQQEKEQAQQRKHKRPATPKTDKQKKKPGRPKGSKNKNKAQKTLSPELARILGWAEQVLALLQQKMRVRYLVLDGHFGNASACQMTRQLGLHLISKMRHDAALAFEVRRPARLCRAARHGSGLLPGRRRGSYPGLPDVVLAQGVCRSAQHRDPQKDRSDDQPSGTRRSVFERPYFRRLDVVGLLGPALPDRVHFPGCQATFRSGRLYGGDTDLGCECGRLVVVAVQRVVGAAGTVASDRS